LPRFHDAFRDPRAHFDPIVGRFVATSGGDGDRTRDDRDDSAGGPPALPPQAATMKFWGLIFDDALNSFKARNEQPKGLPHICNIRSTTNWDAFYERLQRARETYDGTKKGFWGRANKTRRRIADDAEPARRLATFLPEKPYTSPARATVEVLLDAAIAAAEVRQKVINGFDADNLEKDFGDAELFLNVYPKDENITKASIELVVATFKAVEDAISCFILAVR
ncbi:hypothetical protein B0T24DRAFT_693585, partial [Lasiosphaeria ovina]